MQGTGTYKHGKRVWDTITFETEDEVNEFIDKNPEYGVLCVDEQNLIHIAKNSDNGKIIK